MKIAIIGAGFTGLAAAYELTKNNHEVVVFEKENLPGGLASGFKEKGWEWPLEKYYHHLFTSDFEIKNLAKEIDTPFIFTRPKTKSLIGDKIYPLDSAWDVLKFEKLSPLERLRMGAVLAYFKLTPFWQPLEKRQAFWLKKYMGENAYQTLWDPLFAAKFGLYKNKIPLSWFWARIKKRSARLGYPEGGFQNLADELKKASEKLGAKFYFQTEVKKIKKQGGKFRIDGNYFDKVIFTTATEIFLKTVDKLPQNYIERLKKLKTLASLSLVLILKKQFFADGTYWLNICNKNFPFLTIVEHTNFIDKKYYNNQHLVYVGKYLPSDHPFMKMTADELLKVYDPYLKKINSSYTLNAINYTLFKDPFAQPVITLNYSKILPSFETLIKNVYLANMQQVYPWDRGTNYAVELGKKIAEIILKS